MYAVVNTGGKQVKVAPGDRVKVELLDAEVGGTVELGSVALIANGDSIVTGAALAGAKVLGTIVREGRGKKIRVFKYKRRKNYRRTAGHRQNFHEVQVNEIVA
jgi:large subunit ribosomal protein L21